MIFTNYLDKKLRKIEESKIFLLLWISSSDDQISTSELVFIRENFPGSDLTAERQIKFENMLRDSVAKDYICAIDMVRNSLSASKKIEFLKLVVGVAIADNRISITENYLIRFFADALGVSPDELYSIYNEVTGTSLPNQADPSAKKWWENRETNNNKNDSKDTHGGESSGHKENNQSERNRTDSSESLNRADALRILDITEGSSPQEIKQAYRKMTSIHHPDKFHLMGEDAVASKNIIYRKIIEAYEVLKP